MGLEGRGGGSGLIEDVVDAEELVNVAARGSQ
jgi:hypothetical protein